MNGCEWVVEAYGCDRTALADETRLRRLFATLIADLNLRTVGDAVWHQFPDPGGITGHCLLSESHLACHSFPEYGSLCLNLFCCTARPEWEFASYLQREFGAGSVRVRRIDRPYGAVQSAAV
jgi:S-adenosylmethionine decarboxylase